MAEQPPTSQGWSEPSESSDLVSEPPSQLAQVDRLESKGHAGERVPDARFLDHLSTAAELVAARRFAEAESEALRALAIAPSDLRALKLLGLVRFKLGRFEEARSACREIAMAQPLDAGIRLKLGLIALKLDELDEGVRELELSARLAPDDVRPWTYLGFAYARRGDRARAAAAFRRAGDHAHAAEFEAEEVAVGNGDPSGATEGATSPPEPREAASLPASGDAWALEGSVPAALFEPAFELSIAPGEQLFPPPGRAASSGDGAPSLETGPSSNPAGGEQSLLVAPLVGYAVARLEPPTQERAWVGATARLPIGDEIFVRADAAVACTGNAQWEAAFRRVGGRSTAERLGGSGGPGEGQPFLRVTGAGDLFVGAAIGRLVPLLLEDDILYVREDRVLAFEGTVTWEYGHVPRGGQRMLQFRGRGLVAIRAHGEPAVVKVTPDRPLFVSGAHLLGWIGRVVARGIGSPGESAGSTEQVGGNPLGISCEGEGVVLVDVRGPHNQGQQ